MSGDYTSDIHLTDKGIGMSDNRSKRLTGRQSNLLPIHSQDSKSENLPLEEKRPHVNVAFSPKDRVEDSKSPNFGFQETSKDQITEDADEIVDPEQKIYMAILEKMLKKHSVVSEISRDDYIKFKPRQWETIEDRLKCLDIS